MSRRTAEASVAFLLCSAPVAAFAQLAPADREAAIADARAAVARGDNAAAIARLEGARAVLPNDPEILRLLGSAYAYAQRHAEAIATLRQARALAPEDLDIRAALARAYLWSGDREAARSELAAIEARDPANAELAAIRGQLARAEGGEPAAPRRGVFANQGVARVSLDNGPDRTWWSTTLGAFGQVARGTTLSFEGEREDRGTAVDTHLLARIDQQFSPGWRGHVAATVTPGADFREKWSIRGGLEADVGRVTLLADARHADYGTTQVTAVEPGVRVGVPALRSSATLRMINLWDEQGDHRSGWSARIDTETRGGTTLFGGVASYPDTEAGITRRVRSVFLGAAVPVSEVVTIRATGEYERRVDSYTRKGVSLGLQLRL